MSIRSVTRRNKLFKKEIMKKTLLIAAIAAMVLGCGKEKLENQALSQDDEQVSLTLDFTIDNGTSPDTRAVKTDWANNDKIYILFDKEVTFGADNPPQYLVIKYSTNSWVADTWSPGLKKKIANKTSGTLTALYVPNDKVGGTVSIEHSTSQIYLVSSKDRSGKTFKSYALVAENKPYRVSNGVLTARLTLETPSGSGWMQFTISKDRDGNNISSDDAHRYTLKHQVLNSSGGDLGNTEAISTWRYTNAGLFEFETQEKEMSGYYYQGLCFAGNNSNARKSNTKHIFTLIDNKGTSSTDDDVTYEYTWPESGSEYGQLTSSAIVLPNLNSKGGWLDMIYRWKQVQQ